MSLSIIIPVFNLPEMTQQCIDSVIKNTKIPYEIVLIDNGSKEEISEEYKKKVAYYKSPINLMFAKGCNWGAEKAIYPNLCFLNNDTIVTEGWDKPLEYMLRSEDIGLVGVKLLYPDNTIQHAGVEVFNGSPVGGMFNHRYRHQPSNYVHANHIREYGSITGACIFMRKDDFNAVGGFCDDYLNSHEDMDLCYKVKYNLNKKNMYYPDVTIYHLETKTPRDSSNFAYASNSEKFFEKWKDKIFVDILIWNDVDDSERKTGRKMSSYNNLLGLK
jgi:GT2 family glycosyltransferase